MNPRQIKILILSFITFLMGSVVAYDTVCVLLHKSQYEIGMTLDDEEDAKTEKESRTGSEKEKEKEVDETDELFFGHFILGIASHTIQLNFSNAFFSANNYRNYYFADIVPPPPKS